MKDCQDYTMEFERSLMERLSLKQRLGIRFHSAICPECRRYFVDSEAIDRLLKKKFQDKREYQFSEKEKEEIKAKLIA